MEVRKRTLEGLEVTEHFWKKKRVLLTGHTGFKGSWLSLWLQSIGAEVIGFALPPETDPSLFKIAKVEDGMTSLTGDIRNLKDLSTAFTKYNPEIVIHMAAQALVKRSYADPVETYSTNVLGTVNLLEAVRNHTGVKVVLNVTSDKCYDNREWARGYHEEDAMGGYDPYSSSKGCSELVTAAYRNSYFHPERYKEHGVAIASCRAGNVIGGGDWAKDRLIPDIIQAITRGNPVRIRYPLAIRPWQHVLEPLSGYLLLAQKLYEQGAAYAEGWNFGPYEEDAKPVRWIVEKLTKAWGEGARWEEDEGPHHHEAHHLKLDCTKAKERLSWSPNWRLEKTLEAIIDWHRGYQNGTDMCKLTLEQISAYHKSNNENNAGV